MMGEETTPAAETGDKPAEATEEKKEDKGETPTSDLGAIERAEKVRDQLLEAEKRIDLKIAEINKINTDKVLSGRASAVQPRNQEQTDQAKADKIVDQYFE